MLRRQIFCRFCGAAGAYRYGKDRTHRQRWKCPHCKGIFTRRTHTPRSGSRLSDREWQLAEQLFATRVGMSGVDLGNILGYGRRTGQRINRSFRKAVGALVPASLIGTSEWDESVPLRLQWVLGGVSRQMQQCLLRCIPDRSGRTLIPLVEHGSDPEGCIFTDEHCGYIGLVNRWTVNHSQGFVNAQATFVHTNTIEGVWGHLKPLGQHVYRGFPRRTLQEFLAEFMFRYNLPRYKTRLAVLSALLKRPKTNSLVV